MSRSSRSPSRSRCRLAEIEFAPGVAGGLGDRDLRRQMGCRQRRLPGDAGPLPCQRRQQLARGIEAIALAAWRGHRLPRLRARRSARHARCEIFILEINGNPDISPCAGLARALQVAGIEYDVFVSRLIEQAATRGTHRRP